MGTSAQTDLARGPSRNDGSFGSAWQEGTASVELDTHVLERQPACAQDEAPSTIEV